MDGIIYIQLCQPCVLETYECSLDPVDVHIRYGLLECILVQHGTYGGYM